MKTPEKHFQKTEIVVTEDHIVERRGEMYTNIAPNGIIAFQEAEALSVPLYSSKCCRSRSLALRKSQFLSSNSLLKLKKQTPYSPFRIKQLKNPVAQLNFLRVIQTVWKVGKDGIEAGTSLVPDSIPRPIARIAVTVLAATLALFVLKSFLNIAFIALAVMGLSYFTFIALNKDEGTKGGGASTSVEDSLEEARRIMDKYK